MINLMLAAVTLSAPPHQLEFFCPVWTPAKQQANFWIEQNPKWRVQFVGYVGAAKRVSTARKGFSNRITWQDARGRPYVADVNWSNSFGPTGVAATVRIENYAGLTFEGNCYPNQARA